MSKPDANAILLDGAVAGVHPEPMKRIHADIRRETREDRAIIVMPHRTDAVCSPAQSLAAPRSGALSAGRTRMPGLGRETGDRPVSAFHDLEKAVPVR